MKGYLICDTFYVAVVEEDFAEERNWVYGLFAEGLL
jgi:hypothetical protein